MKTRSSSLLVMSLALLAYGPAGATDMARGKALHEEHCVTCHTSLTGGNADSLYTRPKRRVTTLEGLKRQVRRCELNLGLRWFDEDINDVVSFLNENFYHFEK